MRRALWLIGDLVTYGRAIGAATALIVAQILDPEDPTDYVSKTGTR